jgi:hypothetical protein
MRPSTKRFLKSVLYYFLFNAAAYFGGVPCGATHWQWYLVNAAAIILVVLQGDLRIEEFNERLSEERQLYVASWDDLLAGHRRPNFYE